MYINEHPHFYTLVSTSDLYDMYVCGGRQSSCEADGGKLAVAHSSNPTASSSNPIAC